jgi:hypothetical protein
MAALRRIPAALGRVMGVPAKRRANSASSIAAISAAEGKGAGGKKARSRVTGAFRFHGQTSWQTSHPNCQVPMRGASVGSTSPRCSIVR